MARPRGLPLVNKLYKSLKSEYYSRIKASICYHLCKWFLMLNMQNSHFQLEILDCGVDLHSVSKLSHPYKLGSFNQG